MVLKIYVVTFLGKVNFNPHFLFFLHKYTFNSLFLFFEFEIKYSHFFLVENTVSNNPPD